MRRIAILHHALGRFGGAEKMTIQHALHLKKLGFAIELFYGGPIHEEWKLRAESEVKVHKLPFGLSLSYKNSKEIIKLIRYLNQFDVVIFHHHIDPFLAFYLSISVKTRKVWYCGEPLRAIWEDKISGMDYKKLKATVIKTSNESFGGVLSKIFLSSFFYDLSINFIRILDIKAAYSYDWIVTNSIYTKGLVEKVYGIKDNVSVVYPGIDIPKFIKNKQSSNLILCIGALIPMKNHSNLLKAFSLLPNEVKSCYKLLLIGDGALREEIEEQISSLNLNAQVIIKPSVSEEELKDLYSSCKFVVHVALNEPFGLIPVEAALFSKPSVVSNVGGTNETVINGETGFVVNPYCPEDTSKAMLSLIKNNQLSLRMGAKGREKVAYFSIEKSTEGLVEFLIETSRTAH